MVVAVCTGLTRPGRRARPRLPKSGLVEALQEGQDLSDNNAPMQSLSLSVMNVRLKHDSIQHTVTDVTAHVMM